MGLLKEERITAIDAVDLDDLMRDMQHKYTAKQRSRLKGRSAERGGVPGCQSKEIQLRTTK